MNRSLLNPIDALLSAWHQRELLVNLTRREILRRYRGSMLGVLWTLLTPLLLLAVFTFVFGLIFRVRWDVDQGLDAPFAAILFSGLILHGVLAEVLGRAPMVVLDNVNFVKKVVFPLELLPWVTVITAVFHFLLALVILVVFLLITGHGLAVTVFAAPVVILPFLLLIMGVAWFVAALGVYVRDTSHVTGFITTALLFLSPIFYPLSAVPEAYRGLFLINPLTHVINEFRNLLLLGQWPEPVSLAAYWAVSLAIFWLGFAWFQQTRGGFSDVL